MGREWIMFYNKLAKQILGKRDIFINQLLRTGYEIKKMTFVLLKPFLTEHLWWLLLNVRVFNSNAKGYLNTKLPQCYIQNEK